MLGPKLDDAWTMTDPAPPHLALASEFPAATRAAWLKLVEEVLKGRPFERLAARTYDGLRIEPLYDRAAAARPLAARAAGTPWQMLQPIDHPDPAAANAQALQDLENGATGLMLVLAGSIGARGFGLPPTANALARVLDGVHLDAGIAVELDLPPFAGPMALALADLAGRRGASAAAVDLRFGLDPLGALARNGVAPAPWNELARDLASTAAALAARGLRGRIVVADGRVVHEAGGTEAQELAYATASALAYLRALGDAGVPLAQARRMIFFRLAADADEFLTIAKFRALRKLWARVEHASGLAAEPAFITGESAWRMMTQRDPHVNLLRTTMACFAAAVAGADAVALLPFTAALGLADPFARRLARNAQLILAEESNLHRVADPAAGSGAIEDLTMQLGHAAWAMLQQTERAGGIAAALAAGWLQEQVAAAREQRQAAVARRTDVFTGTTAFPHLAEAAVHVLARAPAVAPAAGGDATASALPSIRLAAPFERLRDASDRVLAETGARPRVFLANLGAPAEFTARATFARSFFESGGIAAVGNEGFATLDAMAEAFAASGAALACVCSTDARYAALAADPAALQALAGARHIYLAGRPSDHCAALAAAGVGTFIHAGCDALATLQAAHDMVAAEGRAGRAG